MDDDYVALSWLDGIKNNLWALVMLALALFALYSHALLLAFVPLVWIGYRVGKELGRQEAHDELTENTLNLRPPSLKEHG